MQILHPHKTLNNQRASDPKERAGAGGRADSLDMNERPFTVGLRKKLHYSSLPLKLTELHTTRFSKNREQDTAKATFHRAAHNLKMAEEDKTADVLATYIVAKVTQNRDQIEDICTMLDTEL